MRDHIRILGILNIALGSLTALGALVVLVVMGGASRLVSLADGVSEQDARYAAPILVTVGIVVPYFFYCLPCPRSWAVGCC